MSYIRIASKRKGGVRPQPGELVVVIDRGNPVLGNRHYLADHNDDAARDRCVDAYQRDLDEDASRRGPISKELRLLAEIVAGGTPLALVCWCAVPYAHRRCHGDCHKAFIERILGRKLDPPDEPQVRLPTVQGTLF